MEIVYFVLGIVTVLIVFGVVVIFKVSTLVRKLEKRVSDSFQITDCLANDLERRIHDESRDFRLELSNTSNEIDRISDVMNRTIRELEREVYSQLDSRLDKLENKLIIRK